MDFKSMKNFVIILFSIFSCIGLIKNFYKKLFRHIFSLKLGFSYNWLIILYCYGSYIGKFKLKKKYKFYSKYFFMYSFFILIKYKINIITFNIKKIGKIFDIIDYTTPLEVLITISFIMLFSNLNIENKLFIKFISFFAPLTFGIYFIHGHYLIMSFIIKRNFLWVLKYKNFFIRIFMFFNNVFILFFYRFF